MSLANVVKSVWGNLPDGRAVHAFKLTRGSFVATFVEYGATLVSFMAPDGHGTTEEITLCHKDIDSLREGQPQCYYGATIGRVGNRIANGKFSIDGTEYSVPLNNGPNSLHGGTLGFDKQLWTGEDVTEAQQGSPSVKFSYISSDGEMGYPGEVCASVTFSLFERGLRIVYEATTTKTTPISLTNHTYWNLSGNFSSPTILDHRVCAPNLTSYLPVNSVQIPTGEMASVDGTPFDFREWHSVGQRLKACGGAIGYEGYDHCYIVPQNPTHGLVAVALVHDPISKRSMQVFTDQPGCQLYTGNYIEGVVPHVQYAALCLETQAFPDAVNQHPDQVLLKPESQYRSVTEHHFGIL